MSDARLVEMARAGDAAAFDALVRRFQRGVHAVAFAVLADREAALDVLQESFIAAYRKLPTLADPGKFGAWVCGIARNRAKQWRRDQGRLRARERPLPEGEIAAAPPAGDSLERIREALQQLTEAQAAVVALFYMEGYSIQECASALSVPAGTVKRRLHDARLRLRKEMTEMVAQRLSEFALPEDYRVVIERPSRLVTNGASLAWFAGRWVLVWQDGLQWGPERWQGDHFELWLAESADAKAWSSPRRLEIAATQYPDAASLHLHQVCVHRDRLYVHTYRHHDGVNLYSSADLCDWTAHPRIRLGNAGRAGIFSDGRELFMANPAWVEVEGYHGDRVDLLKSADGGDTWRWLTSPAWPQAGVTDAAGIALDGRLLVAWQEFQGPQGARVAAIRVSASGDGGATWGDPQLIQALSAPAGYGSFGLELAVAGRMLVAAQEVCADEHLGGEVWLAISRDGGQTWPEKAVYSASRLFDPAIAFAPDGSLIIAGSSRTGDESRPWVVHSKIRRR